MLFRILFLLFTFCLCLNAKDQLMSPLPLPSQEVVDLNLKKCSKSCLHKLFDNGEYFSFIAQYQDYKDKSLEEKLNIALQILDSKPLPRIDKKGANIKVALLIPQKNIGRYSVSSADSILSYLIARDDDFEFSVFDSQNESGDNLAKTYKQIQKGGFDYAIAILTTKGLENLVSNIEITTPIFIPTIHQSQAINIKTDNIIFGGIDYNKQVSMLVNIAHAKNVSIISYNDDGVVGKMLGDMVAQKSSNVIVSEVIDSKKATKFNESIAKSKKHYQNSAIILNTAVRKSGLIIPQIGNNKIMPIAFLSTQINYNPYLLRLVPIEDSKKIFVVSAINPLHPRLLAFSDLFSSDLQYDWVNYATALAMDVMLSKGNVRFFKEKLQDNQVIYNDRFYGAKDFHFVPVKLH